MSPIYRQRPGWARFWLRACFSTCLVLILGPSALAQEPSPADPPGNSPAAPESSTPAGSTVGAAVDTAVASASEAIDPSQPEITLEEVERDRADVVKALEAWGARVSPSGAVSVGSADPQEISPATLDLGETVLAKLDAQIGALRLIGEIEEEDSQPRPAAQRPEGANEEDAPFVFEDLDHVLELRDSAAKAAESAREEEADTLRSLEDAERREKLRQQERRRLEENAGQSRGSAGSIAAEKAALEGIWRARAAKQEVRLERLRLDAARASARVSARQLDDLQALAAWMRQRLQVSKEDLDQALATLQEEVEAERERLTGIESELDQAQARGAEAEARTQEGEPAPGAAAEALYHRAVLDLFEYERRMRVGRLEMLETEADILRLRYDSAAVDTGLGLSRKERNDRLDAHQRELERLARSAQRRLEELRAQKRSIEGRFSRLPDSRNGNRRWLEEEVEALDRGVELTSSHLDRVRSSLAMARWAIEEADEEQMRLAEVAGQVRDSITRFWGKELTYIDNRPITPGKVFLALLLIVLGYGFSKRLSQSLASVLTSRFAVSSGAAHALQNLAFYVLVVIFFLWGFQLVGIPLTVFTLLGGVVAIGVGFGSQNVVNNFISGIILLVERPIKVGDLIDVDGVVGRVERIGLRSTRVRAGNNTHIFVPNSSFLEKNVLNWTGSDDLLRAEVDVGVAYGSPVEEVKELMTEALEAESLVLKRPEPEVLFLDFGDSALLFRAYFWHRAHQALDQKRVQSALRFRIDGLMADAGIVIAFPQRDVHLDTLSPLRIALERPPGEEASRRQAGGSAATAALAESSEAPEEGDKPESSDGLGGSAEGEASEPATGRGREPKPH